MKKSVYFKKITINILISLVMLLGAIFIFILPAINKLEAAKKTIEEQKISFEKIYIQGQNLRKTSENIKTVEPGLQDLQKIFVKKEEALNFITSLEKIAEKNNIKQKIGNLNYPTSTDKKSTFDIVPIQITLSGNFKSLIKYLSDLEKLDYYVSVKNLEILGNGVINVTGITDQEAIVDMQINANIYWLK